MINKSIAMIAVFISILMLGGCKDDEKITPNGSLSANAGEDQEVFAGQKVQLDGSNSRDTKGQPITYQWIFTKAPAGSIITLTEASTAKPYFTPDKGGEYEITLTIENENGKASDKVLIKATVAQPVELKGPLTSKTILKNRIADPDLPDYAIMEDLLVQTELIIEPGVIIAVNRDKRIEIAANGSLIAQGTDDNMVRFTGIHREPGYWQGIMVRSASSGNILENVIVEFAGAKPLFATLKAGLFLSGGDKAEITIKNSFFGRNDGYGICLQEGALLRSFSSNSFMFNTLSGILLDADNVASLDSESKFEQNGRNVVEISTSALKAQQTGTITWPAFDDQTPYRLQGLLTIDGHLKLTPGVIIELERNGSIVMNADALLEAKGTANARIKIRGAEAGQGYWKGIICYSRNNGNLLEHTEISGGGSTPLVSGKKANVAVYGSNAVLTIRNSTISNSGGYGLFVNYQAQINDDFETANQFESNVLQNLLKE